MHLWLHRSTIRSNLRAFIFDKALWHLCGNTAPCTEKVRGSGNGFARGIDSQGSAGGLLFTTKLLNPFERHRTCYHTSARYLVSIILCSHMALKSVVVHLLDRFLKWALRWNSFKDSFEDAFKNSCRYSLKNPKKKIFMVLLRRPFRWKDFWT